MQLIELPVHNWVNNYLLNHQCLLQPLVESFDPLPRTGRNTGINQISLRSCSYYTKALYNLIFGDEVAESSIPRLKSFYKLTGS
jgi:hypothetical protein